MSNSIANTVTTNILPVQALYDPTTLAFITFIGPAGTPFTGTGGGVSSVNVSGGTTGLTTSGGPIVSSGTITIAGTLNVANGGTGSTTANGALTNLLPTQTGNSGKFLTTDGTNTSWSTAGSGLTISTDTTTNASRYLTFTATTSGVITSENVSTALYFNPSSGSLTATTFVGALTGNASTATSATTSTNLAGGAAGSIPYQSGSSTTTFLAAGSNGQYLTISGGVPTWANLTYVSSFSGGTTGLTPNTATTGAVTLSGTLAVANGGTGVTSSSGASSVVLRDANANITANNHFFGFTNVAAAGTTTTLTAASTPNYVVTGSGGQTYKLPDATTLPIGAIFTFNNNQTSGSVIVQNNSSTTIVTIPSGGYTTIILLSNSVAAGTWDYHFDAPSNVSWSTNTLSYAGSITNATWNGVSIGAIYGGTGQTSYTTGDTLYASASNTLSKLAIGSTGQVLTVAGGVPTWANTTAATTITDDTTTNATRYINFTSATSGSLTNIGTSSTKLQYNPSTGTITTSSVITTSDITIHGLTVGLGGGAVSSNTAVGVNSLATNSSGAGITSVGYSAGQYQTTDRGTYVGAYAGQYDTGVRNTAIGNAAYSGALGTLTGTYNTAVGTNALNGNTSGSYSVALGSNALSANTSGANNVAVGYQSLISNTTASNNTAVGYQAAYTSNSANNTAIGYQAYYTNSNGYYATAVGYQALYASNGASNPTAVGYQALKNSTGDYNTALGSQALYSNTTASNNTAVGYQAGYSNQTSVNNVFVGQAAGYSTTAGYNTFVGTAAGNQVTSGTYNTAIGFVALNNQVSTGSYNTTLGAYSLYNNTSGTQNVASGYQALYGVTTGANNVAIGYQAGYNNTGSATNCVYIGGYCTASGASVNYEHVIGANTVGKGAQTFIVSSYATVGSGGSYYNGNNQSSWNTTSDQRIKKNIVDFSGGLNILNQLRVRNFEYRLPEEIDADLKPTDAVKITGTQIGVIAQEIQNVLPDCVKQESTGVLSVNPSNLVWYLIDAVKELSEEIQTLKSKVGA